MPIPAMDLSTLSIRREPLDSPAARALTSALDAELETLYPEKGANFLDLASADVAEGRGAFFLARTQAQPVGCGALRLRDAHTAEIKRMYVKAEFRSSGLGRRILDALEQEARLLGARRIVLEAGDRQPAALALYFRSGYARIPAFGEYAGAPLSVCMAKDL